jgi:CheY-like chemotaxis protein
MGKSILIVDDEPAITLTLERFFRSKGYEVLRVFYGDQALVRIEQDPPRLVILDLQMPGVDGIAVLEKIRAAHPEVKVLVITGYSDQYRQQLERLKPDAVKMKPVSLEELTQAVEQLLEGKQPAEPSKEQTVEKIRLLFIEGSEEVFLLYVKPHFEDPQRRSRYEIRFAPGPEEAFHLLEEFKPHLVLLDSTRLAVGVDAGKLAADLSRSGTAPIEVILHSVPRGKGIPAEPLQRLEQAIERAARQRKLAPLPDG